MPRKRKLDATLPDEDDGGAGAAPAAQIGGFWGGSATNMLQARLREVQQSVAEAIRHGVTAIEIEPSMIDDEIGTDRLGDWRDQESFAALVADMRRRGQRQPIRVRPRDRDWAPQAQPPYAGPGRFVLQSGRRRLAAAQELGLPVMAVISTDIGEEKLADLEERFLENTMRQDLSGFEELLSIGLIAQAHSDLSQAEIAQRLAVPPPDVSLGLACVEMHDRILETVDVAQTPKRKYRELIPKLRGTPLPPPVKRKPVAAAPQEKPRTKYVGKAKMQTETSRNGLKITVAGREFTSGEVDQVERLLTEILSRPKR